MAAQDAFTEGHGHLPVLIKTARAWEYCSSQPWPSNRAASQSQCVCWICSASALAEGRRAELWQQSISRPGEQNLPLHRRQHRPRLCAWVMARAAVPGWWRGFDGGLGIFSSLVLAPVDALRFTTPGPNLRGPGDSASLQTPVLPTAK